MHLGAVGAILAVLVLLLTGQGLAEATPTNPGDAQRGLATTDPADLALTMTTDHVLAFLGGSVAFTVTLTNNGPDAAAGVTVGDALPPGLSFMSATPSQGGYDATTGVWTVGSVPSSATVTLTLVASASATGTITNRASISRADQSDPNASNNSASATILVGALRSSSPADVGITKTVNNPNPKVGDEVVFTITMTNHGPNSSTGTSGQDKVPAGLTFISSSGDGNYNSGSGKWTGNLNMANGESHTLVITALVASAGCFTNTATVIHQAENDPNLANDSASVTICAAPTPGQADLAVTKAVDDAQPNVGTTAIFTLTLQNNGPDQATGVAVEDGLPAGLSLVSATPSQGSFSSSTGVWSVGSLANGATATLTLDAVVVSSSPQTNTASTSSSDQIDPNVSNNTASVTVTPQQADLVVGKAVSNATPNVGDTIAYTVIVGNLGPDAATGVTLADLLPAGLSFVSATPSQGTYNAATGAWTVGALPTATAATLTLDGRVVSPDPVTNTGSVSHSDQFDPDVGNNTDSVTLTPQQADLMVTKSVSNPTPNVGETVSFTVTVANNGPSTATGVTLSDLLPAGLSFAAATPSHGTYDPATGLWTIGTVTVGTPQTLSIAAAVTSPSGETNTASISHSDQFDPDATNNTASTSLTPQQADLAVLKTVSNPTPNTGDTITYTVKVFNAGPDNATGVALHDVLPAEVSFQSSSATQGSYDSTSGIWTVGTVASGQTQTLTINAVVVMPSPSANTAAISHSDQFDPEPSNNSDTASVSPQQADLALTKTVSDSTPNVGEQVSFSIALTNNGPHTATGVTVTDLLPAGLTFVSASPTEGTYNSTTGVWTVGTVSDSATANLAITTQVTSPAKETNAASISSADQTDPDPGNNSDSATITPQQADLVVAKLASNPTPNVGDTVTFAVIVGNRGPSTATNVTLTDVLPAGFTFVFATPSQGTYNSATGVWAVASVTTGLPTVLALTARVVSAGAKTNAASVTHSDQFDPKVDNNTASVTVTPQQADLAVTKIVDNARPNVGDTVTFTVTVTDNGPSTATGVTVTDLLPAGLTFLSATPSQGTYNSATGVWTVGTVVVKVAPATVVIAGQVGPNATSNTASISHSDEFDPNPGNNSASVTVTPQLADVAVTKTVDNTHPNVGDTVTFTVTVSDKGPNTATGVTVTDRFPAGLTFVSATPTQGSYDASVGLWTVGTVTPGTPQTLSITATVTSADVQTNIVSISHSDQSDPDSGNNSASVTVTASSAPTPPVAPTVPITPSEPESSGSVTAVQSPAGGARSNLPLTGTNPRRLLLAATWMIVLGLTLRVGARKRRSQSATVATPPTSTATPGSSSRGPAGAQAIGRGEGEAH